MDSQLNPSSLLPVSNEPHVSWDLIDIAEAAGIDPWQVDDREDLAELVCDLDKAKYLPNIIMPQLRNYPWSSHEVDPAKVIESMQPIWDLLDGDISRMPSTFNPERISSFSECLMWWMYYISVECGGIPPPQFPETQAHIDTFGYALFLLMWLRDGPSSEIVSRLYIDALVQVKLDTETRRALLEELREW
ncbi:hypothetical protein GGR58DRAFT_20303 [Xylaria digitata]|nr:hypothetical protein GGR58DRAFT_20303 [Xylaria digitata]